MLSVFSGKALLGVTMIMVGCCLNVVSLEFITSSAPGAGWLLTFLQFLLVTSLGVVQFVRCKPAPATAAAAVAVSGDDKTAAAKLETREREQRICMGLFKRPTIPMRRYLLLTAIFFLLSVINNKALDYKVSVPLHTVFRSSSLTASLIVGFALFRKRYSFQQVMSCLMVTVGIITVTLADSRHSQLTHPHGVAPKITCCGSDGATTALGDALLLAHNATLPPPITPVAAVGIYAAFAAAAKPLTDARSAMALAFARVDDWYIGIAMLFVALWLSALLGHMQDYSYETYGREPDELMFWTHLLSLPGFAVAVPDMWASLMRWCYDTPLLQLRVPGMVAPVPLHVLWMVAFNVATQFLCIRGVHTLTSATNTLTTTVAITVRKFVSLLISVVYFRHAFTTFHWIGSFLTFAGVYWYTYAPRAKPTPKADAVKDVAPTTAAAATDASAQPATNGAATNGGAVSPTKAKGKSKGGATAAAGEVELRQRTRAS